jgi:hypothetical protein
MNHDVFLTLVLLLFLTNEDTMNGIETVTLLARFVRFGGTK